ncbi:MAG: hypothetical protein N3E36_05575 [Sulfolobales archaeon]|nr:hypothetical protein [Sulfolobales archaeon]
MRKILVVIIGPVGVGKSTIIIRLSNFLKNKSVPVTTVFLKAFHGPSFFIWQLVIKPMFYVKKSKLVKVKVKIAPWYMLSRLNEEMAWRLTLLTALMDALIVIPLKTLYIHVYRLIGFNVLCEEYLFGTLTDYIYTYINAKTHKGRNILNFAIKMFTALLLKNKPHVTIVLDASINELLNRWRGRRYGEPQLKYILFQKAFFNGIRKLFPPHNFEIFYIDTSNLKENATLKLVLENVLKLGLG